MVKIKNSLKSTLMPAAAIGILLFATNCKDKTKVVSKEDLLDGDWKKVEQDGIRFDTPAYANYSYLWTFAKTGDFNYCYESSNYPANNACYTAKWTWADVDKTNINIDFAPLNATMDFKVDVLDGDNLNGTKTTNYSYYGNTYSYTDVLKFSKIK